METYSHARYAEVAGTDRQIPQRNQLNPMRRESWKRMRLSILSLSMTYIQYYIQLCCTELIQSGVFVTVASTWSISCKPAPENASLRPVEYNTSGSLNSEGRLEIERPFLWMFDQAAYGVSALMAQICFLAVWLAMSH